jgi:hypothetical protein
MTPGGLAALASSAPEAVLASWDGGTLDLATFAGALDLAALAAAPVDLGQRHLDELLRKTVNDALVRRGSRPADSQQADLAAEVKTERENLMGRCSTPLRAAQAPGLGEVRTGSAPIRGLRRAGHTYPTWSVPVARRRRPARAAEREELRGDRARPFDRRRNRQGQAFSVGSEAGGAPEFVAVWTWRKGDLRADRVALRPTNAGDRDRASAAIQFERRAQS